MYTVQYACLKLGLLRFLNEFWACSSCICSQNFQKLLIVQLNFIGVFEAIFPQASTYLTFDKEGCTSETGHVEQGASAQTPTFLVNSMTY